MRRLRRLLVVVDAAPAVLVWTGVFWFGESPTLRLALVVLAGALSTLAASGVQRLYRARACAVRSVERIRLARASLIGGLASIVAGRAIGLDTVRRSVTGAVLVFVALVALRGWYRAWLARCRAEGRYVRCVVVAGTNDDAAALVELIASQPESGYRIVGVLGSAGEWAARATGVPLLGPLDDVAGTARAVGATGVLIASGALESARLNAVVRRLFADGLHVELSSGLVQIGHRRLRPSQVGWQPLTYVEPPSLAPWQTALKRALDLGLSAMVLPLLAPIGMLAAVLIKLDDGGPVIYRQQRVGRNGRGFEILKFRTMVVDAAARRAELEHLNERSGPLFKLERDPRVTRVGRFLRASSIDEIPQLLNVLRGDMSLVGPRPALDAETARFDDELFQRTSVMPGVTGLWQVEARDNPSFLAYRRLDLFYVENWSVAMDLAILCETVPVVIGRAWRSARTKRRPQSTAVQPGLLSLGRSAAN